MATRTDDSFLFVVEWFDPLPQLRKQYLLKYWPDQNMFEMVDVKSKKMFLKKSPCPEIVTREDFYVGSKILLYSRELEIVDYGDAKTRDRIAFQIQSSILLLPAASCQYWGKIVHELLSVSSTKLTIIHMKTFFFPSNAITKIVNNFEQNLASQQPQKIYKLLEDGVNLAVYFNGDNTYQVVENILKKFEDQYRLVNLFTANANETSQVNSLLFENNSSQFLGLPSTATLDNCTCCVIKPHAVKSRYTGLIIDQIISQGYEISAVRSILFDKIQAEEFLEVYKGVIPEYTDHTIQLSSGLSIALEIRAQNAVDTFRATAGPWDVDMAKELRPETIRAQFGQNRILNAVHCTDLQDDAELECEYCFKLL
jgi:nucleoside-diphosphate kinase